MFTVYVHPAKSVKNDVHKALFVTTARQLGKQPKLRRLKVYSDIAIFVAVARQDNSAKASRQVKVYNIMLGRLT